MYPIADKTSDCNHRRIEWERDAALRRNVVFCKDCETAIGLLVPIPELNIDIKRTVSNLIDLEKRGMISDQTPPQI